MTYKNVVVYCGSHFGNDPAYAAFAGELGEALGKNHFRMIYGGGTVGLMGICADAAMATGGEVTGIIPEVFIAKEQAHRGLTALIEVPDMTVRKQRMIEMGDAFIILPGGIGTLEELADTANQHVHIPWGSFSAAAHHHLQYRTHLRWPSRADKNMGRGGIH